MTKFFVGLYNYFERHKVLFYLSLSVCILFMALFAAQVRFEENVTSFFPDTKDSQNSINVFENLKIKDKIIIMLSGKDGMADADSLIEAAETIKQDLQQQAEGTLIKEIFSKVDENLINSAGDFVYDNLPLFLSDEDYQRLDTLLTDENIAALMQKNYSNLISPAGFALKDYLMRDPLGLGSQTLKHLQDFQLESNYELINEHIFSQDGSTLLMFITPVFNTGSTGKNDKLIRLIEDELQKAEKEHPQLVAEYFGGPSVGVYNARQIKKDTLVTSSIALIIIIVFISLVFKHKKSIPLIITPGAVRSSIRLMPHLLYQRRHFSHCRRCGFRRNGHCLKLLHTHAGASESCIIGATINQRNRLSAYRRQFYYHRRLFRPPLYQF